MSPPCQFHNSVITIAHLITQLSWKFPILLVLQHSIVGSIRKRNFPFSKGPGFDTRSLGAFGRWLICCATTPNTCEHLNEMQIFSNCFYFIRRCCLSHYLLKGLSFLHWYKYVSVTDNINQWRLLTKGQLGSMLELAYSSNLS